VTTPATSSSKKPNGAAAPPPPADASPEWLTWPTERQAAKRLGTSNTQLRAICSRLGLEPVRAFDNSNRYSPALIAEVERVLVVAEEDADGDDNPGTVTETTVTRELVAMLRDQRQHNQQLLTLIVGPMTKVLDSYNAHQERSEARIARLEKQVDEANAHRAQTLEDQEARELAKKEINDKLDRRRELFGVVKGRLPSILQAIEASVSGGVSAEKMTAAAALLKSLDPAQLSVLVDPNITILKPEQRALVRKILGLAEEAKPSEEAKASEPPTETEK
jgi:hypothetical protein